jgi:hypothetical protein
MPKPEPEASQSTMNGYEKFGNCKTWAVVSAIFSASNAAADATDQQKASRLRRCQWCVDVTVAMDEPLVVASEPQEVTHCAHRTPQRLGVHGFHLVGIHGDAGLGDDVAVIPRF